MRSLAPSNRRLRPDRNSYAGALQACRVAADPAAALALLEEMGADGVKADQRCSLAAVAACAAAGRGGDAAGVLEGMVAAGVSTSDGARARSREACMEAVAAGGGGGFERALAALDELDAAAAVRAADRGVVERVGVAGVVAAGVTPVGEAGGGAVVPAEAVPSASD